MKNIYHILKSLAVAGILFTISWKNAHIAPTEIQSATTPGTWKLLAIAPAGDNVYTSGTDNNDFTRGRFYYFRMRHILPNGPSPWSGSVGSVWLTGNVPENGTYISGKTDNVIRKIP